MLNQTPLTAWHRSHNARMAEFAGYDMPIQYTSVIEEHECVRKNAGLFDVSHMGLLRLEGNKAATLLDRALTRNISKLKPGRAVYAIMCHENGGTIDDLIVYSSSENEFYLVLNASNKMKDLAHINSLDLHSEVRFESLFNEASIFALQGPKVPEILALCGFTKSWKPFDFIRAEICNISVQIAFTGYTGEKGCEIFVSNSDALNLWTQLMTKGHPLGLRPCGLACRDTLRLEMGYSLYGHELNDQINPIEAGLDWAVDFNKSEFIGRKALLKSKEFPERKMIALQNSSKQAPRAGMKIYDAHGHEVGSVCSGTYAPSLGFAIGLGLVTTKSLAPYSVEIRNQKIPFESTTRPFYNKVSIST